MKHKQVAIAIPAVTAVAVGWSGAAESRKQGLRWLLKRQNSDGGWGAFDQMNPR